MNYKALTSARYFFFIFFLSIASCFSQTRAIDSLKNLLEKSTADTSRINLLNTLANALAFNDYDKAADYAQQALILSQKINSTKGDIRSNLTLGMISRERGNFEKALPYLLSALKMSEETGYKFGIGSSSSTIGTIYHIQGNNAKALEYLNKSLEIAKEINSKTGMSACLGNIGQIYQDMGDCEKTLYYNSEALKIDEELKSKHDIGLGLNNVGVAYALKCPGKAFPNNKKALEYFQKAYETFEQIDDRDGMAMSINNVSGIYLDEKDFSAAVIAGQKGMYIAKAMDSKENLEDAYKNLADAYEGLHDYKNSYEFHKLFSEEKDSLLNEQSNKQITEMQTKYETEKKEQQINLLNKDKEIQKAELKRQQIVIWSVAGGLMIVLLLSVFIFRERRKSEKLLLNILPEETAKELKSNGKATPRHYESVTVMFTDFKNFTTIAEKLSPEELVSELDLLFRKFDEIISKYNIEKIKTIGDAYMCASGLPTPNSNHAENIVKAAIEIQQFMTSPRSSIDDHPSPDGEGKGVRWLLRIGIHTGPVTAGVVGDKKFAYDIWGDTVNTASRMESSGEAGKINISGATYAALQPFLQSNLSNLRSVFRGNIPAKNKGEIEMYFVEHI